MKKITSGVYFLYENDELVYIGESENVFSRIGTHIKEGVKDFDNWTYVEVDNTKNRKHLESFLINICKPKYNISSKTSFSEELYIGDYFLDEEIAGYIDIHETFYSYVDLQWISDVLKIDKEMVKEWISCGLIPKEEINNELPFTRIRRRWVIDHVKNLLEAKTIQENINFKRKEEAGKVLEELLNE